MEGTQEFELDGRRVGREVMLRVLRREGEPEVHELTQSTEACCGEWSLSGALGFCCQGTPRFPHGSQGMSLGLGRDIGGIRDHLESLPGEPAYPAVRRDLPCLVPQVRQFQVGIGWASSMWVCVFKEVGWGSCMGGV